MFGWIWSLSIFRRDGVNSMDGKAPHFEPRFFRQGDSSSATNSKFRPFSESDAQVRFKEPALCLSPGNRRKMSNRIVIPILIVLCHGLSAANGQTEQDFGPLGSRFGESIRPLMQKYCLGCHSTEKMEGDLDLERFATLEAVRKEPELWRHVSEQISSGEMPPKKRPHPSDEEEARILAWIREYLRAEALAAAGDPGPVLLRRLTNVEYDNTIQDLTGFDFDATREFPVDGAAGEGFSNVGEALAMSPALLEKYLEAARKISAHMVLLPDGVRFSASETPADWTNEYLDAIRAFYRARTEPVGHTRVKLQGLEWDTNAGGRIPVKAYLDAVMELPKTGEVPVESIREVAKRRSLSPKYLEIVWRFFAEPSDDLIASRLQSQFRQAGKDETERLAAAIQRWQMALSKFGSVGHFKPWLGTADPLVRSVAVREKLATKPDGSPLTLHLAAVPIGEFGKDARIVWRSPRLERPGKSAIPMGGLNAAIARADAIRNEFARTGAYLETIDRIRTGGDAAGAVSWKDEAAKAGLDAELLAAWGNLAGIGAAPIDAGTLMKGRLDRSGSYDFVKGWGRDETPVAVANSSNQDVRVPGFLKARSLAVHPAPKIAVVVAWKSPIDGRVRIEAKAEDIHGDCGNGVTWALESRRGKFRRTLAAGVADTAAPNRVPVIENFDVRAGQVITLTIGPRDGEHSCDLTGVEIRVTQVGGEGKVWSLADDVVPDIHAGNPHADRFGNAGVWSFLEEPIGPGATSPSSIPNSPILADWLDAIEDDPAVRKQKAARLARVFGSKPGEANADDLAERTRKALFSLQGPLLGAIDFGAAAKTANGDLIAVPGQPLKIEIPADWAEGASFVADAIAGQGWGETSAAQIAMDTSGSASSQEFSETRPILTATDAADTYWKRSFERFRSVFPAALCYPQIVPVDEVVTVALFHREDNHLIRLLLDDQEKAQLDSLWNALRFVSQEPLKVEVGYKQFMEYVTQDGDVRVFEPLRKPIRERAQEFRQELVAAESAHWRSLLQFADRAWRRPLSDSEKATLKGLYDKLRTGGTPHDQAVRLVFTRILLAPAFLYLTEPTDSPDRIRPLTDHELASRLSYFLWSSMPDDELRNAADEGRLRDADVLKAQVRRMARDPKARALATEFLCQWLTLKDFDRHDEKSERIFPEFAELRGPMYEEVVRFFTDIVRSNRPILEVLDSDRSFLNGPLADFYGIEGVAGDGWKEVSGMKRAGRGGLLGFAALTAKQSGASRTSPILRGNWLLESLLGEKLPKPPKNVPQLPESELDTEGLTMRQITEKHRADPACAKCHDRIDPFGMALEAFDAIGRRRKADLGGRPIDTSVTLPDGTKFEDIEGLRDYLIAKRREPFERQFFRKLLGYALGRSVTVSDDPLLDALMERSKQPGQGVVDAIEAIVTSPQFRNRRGVTEPLQAE